MSEISDTIVFKNDKEEIEIDQKFVGLKTRADGIMTINFRCPQEEIRKVNVFFSGFKGHDPLKIDIGNTGDLNCYFKGMAPLLKKTDDAGFIYFFLSVTVQELKNPSVEDIEGGCGCF